MAGPNPLLTKTFDAGGAIAKYRILKAGAADEALIQATGVTAAMFAVADETVASGDRVDAVISGLTEVEFGGTVARGGYVTSDANGKAVVASPAAGVNSNVLGIAMASYVLGDIGNVLIGPGRIQG